MRKKLEKLGLRMSRFQQTSKLTLYNNVESSVRLNGVMTDWLHVKMA